MSIKSQNECLELSPDEEDLKKKVHACVSESEDTMTEPSKTVNALSRTACTTTLTTLEGWFFTPSTKITDELSLTHGTSEVTLWKTDTQSETESITESKIRLVMFSDITYKSLIYMPTVTFEKYMITPRHRLRKMTVQDYKKEIWTEVPMLPAVLMISFRHEHEIEVANGNSFLNYLKKESIHDPQLLHLFNIAYSHATNFEMISIFCSNLNAFELFSLLLIFLSKLEAPLLWLNNKCVSSLKDYSADIPLATDERRQLLRNMEEFCINADVRSEKFETVLNDLLFQLYENDTASRQQEFEAINTIQQAIRTSLTEMKDPMRKILARFILRNLMLEILRITHSKLKLSDHTVEIAYIDLQFKKQKEEVIRKVSTILGPLLIDLPPEFQNQDDNFKEVVVRGLLWRAVPNILYRKQKRSFITAGALLCHEDCLCGYGVI